MSIEKFVEQGKKVVWSAYAALQEGLITSQEYSGIISGKVNPNEALPEEYLERGLYRTGGLSGYYQ